MVQAIRTIPMSQIVLDEEIYPRNGVYQRRVAMVVEEKGTGKLFVDCRPA